MTTSAIILLRFITSFTASFMHFFSLEKRTFILKRFKLWCLIFINFKRLHITAKKRDSNLEVISLIGHTDVPLYILSIFSLFNSTKMKFKVTACDDGTMNSLDKRLLIKFIKNIRIYSKDDANSVINNKLDKYPAIKKYRDNPEKGMLIRKHIDCIFLAKAKRILLIDADVLFFKTPNALLSLINSFPALSSFISDYQNAYSISPCEVKKYLKIDIIRNFNSGLVLFSKSDIDFNLCENFLNLYECFFRRTLTPQILFALSLSKLPKNSVVRLPKIYCSTLKSRVESDVCKHYISPIRNDFYEDAKYIFI